MSDLIKRLREVVWATGTRQLCHEAADRIEELEGALREIGSGAYNDEWSADLARQALGEDKNE